MNQSKPRFQSFDGYSAPPPPPPAGSGGGTAHLASESSVQLNWRCCGECALILCGCLFFVLFYGGCMALLHFSGRDDISPRVQVDSVSVSLENIRSDESDLVTVAKWDLGFSVNDKDTFSSSKYNNYAIKDLYVWVTTPPQNWTGTSVKTFGHNSRNLVNVGATIHTLLPHYNHRQLIQGLTLEFEALLHIMYKRSRLEVMCNNLTVAFLPNATQGMMNVGPRSCGTKIVHLG